MEQSTMTQPTTMPGSGTAHPAGAGRPEGIHAVGAVRPDGYVYQRAPMLVYWETTLACDLACVHCRATAMPHPAPDQLTTDEGLALRCTPHHPPRPGTHALLKSLIRRGQAAA